MSGMKVGEVRGSTVPVGYTEKQWQCIRRFGSPFWMIVIRLSKKPYQHLQVLILVSIFFFFFD